MDKLAYINDFINTIIYAYKPYVHFILLFFLLLLVASAVYLIIKILRKKRVERANEAAGSYYSNLSAEEIISSLKDMDMPGDEHAMLNKIMEFKRTLGEQKTHITSLETALKEFIEMQGSISKNFMRSQEEYSVKLAELKDALQKQIQTVETALRADADQSRKHTAENTSYISTRIDVIEKDLDRLKEDSKEHKNSSGSEVDPLIKDQEILSERLSTLNEHLSDQKNYLESKIQNIGDHSRKLLSIEKDTNLLKSGFQDLQAYVQGQFANFQRTKQFGSDASFKEFGDFIKEKIENFFNERKNQLQKIEIELDELKNMDTVKQNVLMRLQKEFSARLSDVNLRLTENKKTVSDQLMNSESIKRQLLALEKGIQELNIRMQGKQHEMFSSQDLRLQSFEDRFNKLSEEIDKKDEETGQKHLHKSIDKQQDEITMLHDEIEKLKKFISLQKHTPSPGQPSGDLENQLSELKGMVFSLIDSLKE
ncbi:MAG: hypothetical protein ABII23_04450 [bacterium]